MTLAGTPNFGERKSTSLISPLDIAARTALLFIDVLRSGPPFVLTLVAAGRNPIRHLQIITEDFDLGRETFLHPAAKATAAPMGLAFQQLTRSRVPLPATLLAANPNSSVEAWAFLIQDNEPGGTGGNSRSQRLLMIALEMAGASPALIQAQGCGLPFPAATPAADENRILDAGVAAENLDIGNSPSNACLDFGLGDAVGGTPSRVLAVVASAAMEQLVQARVPLLPAFAAADP